MPADMRRSRAAKKLLLVCLAKVCQNEHGLECYPSRSTMALAAECSERTIDAYLTDLVRRGFISETDKPRRHRPRTWCLHVDSLLDLQPIAATLRQAEDSQPIAATLATEEPVGAEVLDRQSDAVDLQLGNLDSQIRRLDSQPCVATERSERSYERSEQVPGAIAPPVSSDRNEPTPQDFAVTKRLAFETIEELGPTAAYPDLTEGLKTKVARLHINYNTTSIHVSLLTALSATKGRLGSPRAVVQRTA